VGVVGKSGVPEWRPALELLKHHPNYRENWYPHREIEVHNSGTVSVEHQLVKQLTPAELEAAYEAIMPLLTTASLFDRSIAAFVDRHARVPVRPGSVQPIRAAGPLGELSR